MRSWCKVQPCSNMPLIVSLLLISILPKTLLLMLLLPKHQINRYFIQQMQANVLSYTNPLLICNSILVYYHKIRECLRKLMNFIFRLFLNKVENQTIFTQIVTDCIVYLRNFRNVELLWMRVVEILL
jgi:hypothetical protein